MKGILTQDFIILFRKMRFIIAVTIVLSLVPGISVSAFAILYASMLPVTVLSFEQQAKWERYAAMLPYDMRDIVLSKYLLGLICAASATLFCLLGVWISALARQTSVDPAQMCAVLLMFALALAVQSLNLPFMFKLGVEKGRMTFIVLAVLCVPALLAIVNFAGRLPMNMLCLTGTALAVALYAVSAHIALRIYAASEH